MLHWSNKGHSLCELVEVFRLLFAIHFQGLSKLFDFLAFWIFGHHFYIWFGLKVSDLTELQKKPWKWYPTNISTFTVYNFTITLSLQKREHGISTIFLPMPLVLPLHVFTIGRLLYNVWIIWRWLSGHILRYGGTVKTFQNQTCSRISKHQHLYF